MSKQSSRNHILIKVRIQRFLAQNFWETAHLAPQTVNKWPQPEIKSKWWIKRRFNLERPWSISTTDFLSLNINWKIWIKSSRDKGRSTSTFWVSLLSQKKRSKCSKRWWLLPCSFSRTRLLASKCHQQPSSSAVSSQHRALLGLLPAWKVKSNRLGTTTNYYNNLSSLIIREDHKLKI